MKRMMIVLTAFFVAITLSSCATTRADRLAASDPYGRSTLTTVVTNLLTNATLVINDGKVSLVLSGGYGQHNLNQIGTGLYGGYVPYYGNVAVPSYFGYGVGLVPVFIWTGQVRSFVVNIRDMNGMPVTEVPVPGCSGSFVFLRPDRMYDIRMPGIGRNDVYIPDPFLTGGEELPDGRRVAKIIGFPWYGAPNCRAVYYPR